jgi:hypothetical protein
MADENGNAQFAVHDVAISNQPQFNRAGVPTTVQVVTFWIGDHGPFQLTYAAGQGTPDKVRSDIASQVADLRRTLAPFES